MWHSTSFLIHAQLISGILHILNYYFYISSTRRRGEVFCRCKYTCRFRSIHTVWGAMTNNGSGTSLSLLIQSRQLLTPPAVYLLCLKVHTHDKCKPGSIPAHWSSLPLWGDWGCAWDRPSAISAITCINLELLPCHRGIILNNVHNPSPAYPSPPKPLQGHLNTGWPCSNGKAGLQLAAFRQWLHQPPRDMNYHHNGKAASIQSNPQAVKWTRKRDIIARY